MKKKVLLSSILTIALCLSLIAGSTFALFTSQSEVNIAVTAGKVDMVASIENLTLYSVEAADGGTEIDENNNTYNYVEVDKFTNGGTAAFNGAVLTMDKITPGDKVTFDITGTNNSDVAIQYRYIIECTDGYMLMSGLNVSVNKVEYNSLASYTSAWASLEAKNNMEKVPVTIELPITAGNEYQGESTSIRVVVEAVQGNAVIDNGDAGVLTIDKNVVGNAADLAAALTATDKNIVVVLANDIDLPIDSLGDATPNTGEYKLGGADTETIVIDLNGHKLNLTTTYQSALGAKNANATITIKDGSMNSTGNKANTWNNYDIEFYDCNYVIENVTFDKAIALQSNAILKNVTINETHDYYALWISAVGQNVEIDGLTVNAGRGIKIDEEYVRPAEAIKKVTLSVSNADINTAKKAAIVVKSAAGADITLSNVDISGVVADINNAVWVDADATEYAGLVTVNGGKKINESDLVANTAELDAALKAGKTEILMAGGTYNMPASAKGKNLTLTGLGATVIEVVPAGQGEANGQLDYNLDGSTVTFSNLTIKTNNKTYAGYARLSATYNNCTIENQYCLNGTSTFNYCTFNVSGDAYNVWTWGAPAATFQNCTFNSDGKAVLLYGQKDTKLTVDGCTFNDNGGLTDLKAAIEIGNDYNKSYELIVNETTVNGYEINDKGINTCSTLWANKNSMGADKLNVVVDGVDVY